MMYRLKKKTRAKTNESDSDEESDDEESDDEENDDEETRQLRRAEWILSKTSMFTLGSNNG